MVACEGALLLSPLRMVTCGEGALLLSGRHCYLMQRCQVRRLLPHVIR